MKYAFENFPREELRLTKEEFLPMDEEGQEIDEGTILGTETAAATDQSSVAMEFDDMEKAIKQILTTEEEETKEVYSGLASLDTRTSLRPTSNNHHASQRATLQMSHQQQKKI